MQRSYLVLYLLVVLLGACAQLGLTTPQTFNQKIAVGYMTATTLRETAVTLLEEKKISPDDAQNVQDQADTAAAAMELARRTHAKDPKAAESKLNTSITVLNALEAYLTAKGGGK